MVHSPPELATERLRLRGWREGDIDRLAAINANAEVMAHLGGPISRRENALTVGRFVEKWAEEPRFGWWALERLSDRRMIGFAGIAEPDFREPPAPCVEIGWRLERAAWGRGYATEAGRACLAHGFEAVGLGEIFAFVVPGNARSIEVARRLGMTRAPDLDFDHPLIRDPLRGAGQRHLVHRIRRADWASRRG